MFSKIVLTIFLLFATSECFAIQPGAYSKEMATVFYESMVFDAISKIKNLDAKRTLSNGINLHILKNSEQCVIDKLIPPAKHWHKKPSLVFGFTVVLKNGNAYFGVAIFDMQAKILFLVKEITFIKTFSETYALNPPMGLCQDKKDEP